MAVKSGTDTHSRLFDKLEHLLSPIGVEIEEKAKRILSGFMIIFTAPVLLTFSGIHLVRADYPLGFFLLITGGSLAVTIPLIRKIERIVVLSRIHIGFVGVLFLYLLAESGPYGYMAHWLYVYPLVTFFMLGRREGLFYNAIFFLFALIFLIFQEHLSWTTVHQAGFKSRFLVSLFLVNVLAYTFELVRYKFEERLRQNQVKLEEEKVKLADAKKEADRANAAKSEFLANMSHELRTPLNHIIGFTEVVVDGHFGDLNPQQKEYLGDSLAGSRHLLSLINDILDLSKVEAGKLELELTDVNLRVLLENSLVMVKEKALKHNITLSSDLDGIPESIQADERKIKQIQYNLLSNAVKFTPSGGRVRLNAGIADLKDPAFNFQELKNQQPQWIHICVTDSGIGLSKEDLDRIFLPFEQVENTKSRKYQGTGLGLSLTKKLVELHGGKIWAESEGDGKGAILHYTLPLEVS